MTNETRYDEILKAATAFDPEQVAGLLAAAEEVDYYFRMWDQAKTRGTEASYLVELFNKMSDLRSWLVGYDWEHDQMWWEREDEEYAETNEGAS